MYQYISSFVGIIMKTPGAHRFSLLYWKWSLDSCALATLVESRVARGGCQAPGGCVVKWTVVYPLHASSFVFFSLYYSLKIRGRSKVWI